MDMASSSALRTEKDDPNKFSRDVHNDTKDVSLDNQTRTKKLFSSVQLFAFSLTYMCVWEGMCSNMYFALYNGGPNTFFFSLIIVLMGTAAQAASLAEMASMQPIAGAQYHWTFHLAPRSIRRFATWIQGWTTWFGYVSILAGIVNVVVLALQSMIELNHKNYTPEGWHTAVLAIAISVLLGAINIYAFQIIPWAEVIGGILHVLLFIVFVVVMLVLGNRHSAEFVFLENIVYSGWDNNFIAWNVGMLTCVWSFTAFDSAIHMAEETREAKLAVPRAMFWSIIMNGILAIIMVLTILISMGTVEEALNSTFPITTILMGITKSKPATTALSAFVFFISTEALLACIASVSRLTWAWARDGGLHQYFAYVDPIKHVPVRAVVLTVILVSLLCLLNISSASYVAFGGITALGSLALYISYAIAIGSMIYARTSTKDIKLGEWNLGRYGLYVNIYAMVHTLYITVFLPFPTTVPVDAENMNYGGPIMGLVLTVVIALWFIRARKHWKGPNMAIIDIVMAKS